MLIKPKILTTKAFFQEFSAPGTPVPFAVGTVYATDVIDRSSSPTFAEFVEVELKASSGTPTGTVDVYVYGSFYQNTVTVPGYTNEPTSASALYNGQVLLSPKNNPAGKWKVNTALTGVATGGWKLAGNFVPGAATGDVARFHFNVAPLFGGVVPMKFVILAHNKTDVTLNSLGPTYQWCQVTGYQVETV